MTAKITQIYQSPILRKDIAELLESFDVTITEAIDELVDAGVPLLLMKSILESHVTIATLQMVSDTGDDDEG
jgi:late competence protein required for DNA uptake (superfamily II DNA/RNA helicase)